MMLKIILLEYFIHFIYFLNDMNYEIVSNNKSLGALHSARYKCFHFPNPLSSIIIIL